MLLKCSFFICDECLCVSVKMWVISLGMLNGFIK